MSGSLHKRGKNWYTTFYLNGKRIERSLGITAVDRGRTVNKRQAEEAMRKLIAEYSDNPERFNNITFADYVEKWLKRKAASVEVGTIEGYKGYCDAHIIPYFEQNGLKLSQVTTKDIEAYYNAKATGGRLDGKPGGLSIVSIRKHKALLNQIFQDALREDLIVTNPCQYAKMPKIKTKQENVWHIYTAEQCNELLELVKGTIIYDMLYITFIYGLRRSELMGLKWSAVDFGKNEIEICHTITTQKTISAKDGTKNSSSHRTYPLLKEIREMLLARQKQQDEYRQIFGNRYQDTGYIFVKENGEQYHPGYPSKKLHKIIKRNNLPSLRWHDLRHSCASMLLDKGWKMKEISDWLGHQDISTTMNLYTHLNIDHKRQLAESLTGTLK